MWSALILQTELIYIYIYIALIQKNPRAHKIKSALPPPKTRNFMDMAFSCRLDAFFPGVHEIGAAISGPRISDKNFTDTRIFLKLGGGRVGIPWTCYRGHLGPSDPKLQIVPGPSRPQGPKSPKQSRKGVKIVEKWSTLTLFRLRFVGLFLGPWSREARELFFGLYLQLWARRAQMSPVAGKSLRKERAHDVRITLSIRRDHRQSFVQPDFRAEKKGPLWRFS